MLYRIYHKGKDGKIRHGEPVEQNRITIGIKTIFDSSDKKQFIDFCVSKKVQWIPSNKG
jgi:hypothetical protein